MLVLPSHTHSGPGGFANFPTYNTAAPSTTDDHRPVAFVELLDPEPADPQLYTFLATRSRSRSAGPTGTSTRPRPAGASRATYGVTRNRSIEAHLADHGIIEDRGDG